VFDILLEDGIPVPPPLSSRQHPRKRHLRYGGLKATLAKAQPGQSFLYPSDRAMSARKAAQSLNIAVEVRDLHDGFVRIWIKD
jgi:hypothetical protein